MLNKKNGGKYDCGGLQRLMHHAQLTGRPLIARAVCIVGLGVLVWLLFVGMAHLHFEHRKPLWCDTGQGAAECLQFRNK